MNFGFDDEQRAIQETARELLAKRVPMERVRKASESGGFDEELWREICELGWPGIAIAEEDGGQGLGLVEAAILSEQLGYTLAPVPFLASTSAALMISANGSEEQRGRWLGAIASGEARGAAALTLEDEPIVVDAEGADVIALPGDGGSRLVEGADAQIEPLDLIDGSRGYARVSASGGEPMPGTEEAAFGAMVVLAAELTGIAQRALEMAVAYAKEREQFGRPIGAYQAVSHRCAEMFYDTEEARSLTYYAAWVADSEPESLPMAASMAKARASDAAWNVTANALQVFGGIGFTWEHDIHLLLKRARVDG